MTDVDFFTPGARLALELECLLMDTRNDAAQSRWWDSAHEALEQWRQAVWAMEAAIDAAQPGARSGVEAEPPSASAGVGGKMAEVVRFLMGEAPLEGRWFDEPDPHVVGAYWWRKHLTEALAQQPAATSETVNVIGMPEFDGLLDHIYEHGTAAEGVIEKANALARAVIARYAPQQRAAVDGTDTSTGRHH